MSENVSFAVAQVVKAVQTKPNGIANLFRIELVLLGKLAIVAQVEGECGFGVSPSRQCADGVKNLRFVIQLDPRVIVILEHEPKVGARTLGNCSWQ